MYRYFSYYLTLVFLILFFSSAGQKKGLLVPGEKITYGAYYNWHFIWIRSGQVNFSLNSIKTSAGERWKMRAEAHTFRMYDRFYKIRDTVESICLPNTFEPEYYEQIFNHGNERSYYMYKVPPPRKQIFSDVQRFGKPAFRDTLAFTPGISDMLATAYKFRTHDFSNLTVGEKVPFTMLVDNEVHNIYYRYLGKETITNRNKIPFTCHKFSILLLQGDFFAGGEYLKVWIDDSPNQLPVMVETKILVGSVKAIIETAEINGKPLVFEF